MDTLTATHKIGLL